VTRQGLARPLGRLPVGRHAVEHIAENRRSSWQERQTPRRLAAIPAAAPLGGGPAMYPLEDDMARSDRGAVRSTAAIAGHPIHLMLVPFPVAFLGGALATDLAFWGTGDLFWARGSAWLLGAGIVTGVLAAIAGLIDFLTISRARSLAAGWVHFLGSGAAIGLAVWNLSDRLGGGAVAPSGILLSAVVVVIFLVTGWLGGELVLRHRIGLIEREPDAPPSGRKIWAGALDPTYAGNRPPTSLAPDEPPALHEQTNLEP
jgi:uncharacterized membrane protein